MKWSGIQYNKGDYDMPLALIGTLELETLYFQNVIGALKW